MATHASGNSTWVDYPSTATPISAARLEATENKIDQLTTAMFGGVGRSRPPAAYCYATNDFGWAVGANVFMNSGFAKQSDPDGMVTMGTSQATPMTITLPVDGEYLVEWHLDTDMTTGLVYIHVVLNGNALNNPTTAIIQNTIMSNSAGGTPDGARVGIARTRDFVAGDQLTFCLYPTAAGQLRTNAVVGGAESGQPRATSFGARYLGPRLAP